MNFREIFNNDRQKVRNIIRLVTKENADVCEDLEQEVYIKAFKNKEKYKEKGKFTKKEFDEMYRAVYEKWLEDREYLFSINSIENDINKGKRLYNCSIENKSIKIGNTSFDDSPQEVARGICNFLANDNSETQNYSIGWHPDYKRLLNEVDND